MSAVREMGRVRGDKVETSSNFIEVLDESALPENEMRIVKVQGRLIALMKCNGKIHALGDTCPHLGGSLGKGVLKDGNVICPRHHWTFDLETGEVVMGVPGEKVPVYPVKVENEKILLKWPG